MKRSIQVFLSANLMIVMVPAMASQITWDMNGEMEYFQGSQFLSGESAEGQLIWDRQKPELLDMTMASDSFAMQLRQAAPAEFFFDAGLPFNQWVGGVWGNVRISRYQGQEVDIAGTYNHTLEYDVPDRDFNPLIAVPDFADISVWFFDGVTDIDLYVDGFPVSIQSSNRSVTVPEPGSLILLILALLLMVAAKSTDRLAGLIPINPVGLPRELG